MLIQKLVLVVTFVDIHFNDLDQILMSSGFSILQAPAVGVETEACLNHTLPMMRKEIMLAGSPCFSHSTDEGIARYFHLDARKTWCAERTPLDSCLRCQIS